jgi:TolA-binding protein
MNGMGGIVGMMLKGMGPFGPCCFDDKDNGYDILMLGMLAGLAKTYDTPEKIKENIAMAKLTAKMYVDALELQAKEELEAKKLKDQIRSAEGTLEDWQRDVTRLEKKLVLKSEALAETDSIIEKTLGEAKDNPKSKAGQQLFTDRASIVNEVETLRMDVEYAKGELAKQVERVAKLKGESTPVQPPVAVPELVENVN